MPGQPQQGSEGAGGALDGDQGLGAGQTVPLPYCVSLGRTVSSLGPAYATKLGWATELQGPQAPGRDHLPQCRCEHCLCLQPFLLRPAPGWAWAVAPPCGPGRAWTRVSGLRSLSVTLLAPVGELHPLILLTQPSVPADPHQKGHLWGHARAPKLAISVGPAADKSTVLSSEYQKGERSGGGWKR